MQTITDIFGNVITVTHLADSIQETKTFVGFSENAGNDDFTFDEFRLIQLKDIYGKSFKTSERVPNGKSVKALVYYQHNLTQLLNLTN